MKLKPCSLSLLLALLAVAGIMSGCAGTTPAAAPAAAAPVAAKPSLAGEFTGEWRGQNQSSGAVRLKFAPGKEAAWTAAATFTYGGNEIPTTTKSVRVDGDRVELVFAWEVEGTAAATTLVGNLNGDRLEGSYDSTTAEGAAAGKWWAARATLRR